MRNFTNILYANIFSLGDIRSSLNPAGVFSRLYTYFVVPRTFVEYLLRHAGIRYKFMAAGALSRCGGSWKGCGGGVPGHPPVRLPAPPKSFILVIILSRVEYTTAATATAVTASALLFAESPAQ